MRLAVSSLPDSLAFYSQTVGLKPLAVEDGFAQLGAEGSDRVLLELQELPGLQPLCRQKRLGLYHFAVLLPARKDLANFVQHAQESGVPFGAADHLASEATYLVDPDGLTVEVYADRPRDQWTWKGQEVVLTVDPLDYDGLLAEADGTWHGAPEGTTIGHMHFFVGNLDRAKAFYCDGLGLSVMSHIPGALFVAAGGYHHHVGLNTWAAGSPVAGSQDPRLLFWEWVLPSADDAAQTARSQMEAGAAPNEDGSFADPWGIRTRLRVDD